MPFDAQDRDSMRAALFTFLILRSRSRDGFDWTSLDGQAGKGSIVQSKSSTTAPDFTPRGEREIHRFLDLFFEER